MPTGKCKPHSCPHRKARPRAGSPPHVTSSTARGSEGANSNTSKHASISTINKTQRRTQSTSIHITATNSRPISQDKLVENFTGSLKLKRYVPLLIWIIRNHVCDSQITSGLTLDILCCPFYEETAPFTIMGPRRSTRSTTKKTSAPLKKGRGKKEKTPKKEKEEAIQEPSSPTSISGNDENAPPPSKSKTSTRERRTRTKKAVSYQEDSDTDPCSDDEASDAEEQLQTPAKGKKRAAAAAKKQRPAVKAAKKQKVDRSTLVVRPPDGNSPRPIVGKEIPSPSDWRVSTCMDY